MSKHEYKTVTQDIIIDNNSPTPKYQQIVEQIISLIIDNKFKSGCQMPTIRELSHKLGVNPATVSHAYSQLRKEGILIASRRRGTWLIRESEKS